MWIVDIDGINYRSIPLPVPSRTEAHSDLLSAVWRAMYQEPGYRAAINAFFALVPYTEKCHSVSAWRPYMREMFRIRRRYEARVRYFVDLWVSLNEERVSGF
jgi:hypothetical protein